MAKLSLNKASAYAGKAKADILKALKSDDPSKKLSGDKNDRGHWEIETSELDRFFGKRVEELVETDALNRSETSKNSHATSALEVEVKMLREQMGQMETMHDRERQLLVDQIEDMKVEAERRNVEHMTALAALTDQREQPKKRRFFGLLAGG